MTSIKYTISVLSILSLIACSCELKQQVESVEIHYTKRAPWGQLRFMTYGKEHLLESNGRMFRLESEDSLSRIRELVKEWKIDTCRREKYEDAVIVALLRYADCVDTVETNARPEFRLNCNSSPLHDSSMVMFLIDAVVSRDRGWRESFDSLYYDKEFHYLSRSGYSQDPPHEDAMWVYNPSDE